MPEPTAIDAVIRRLQLALDALEAALDRRLEAGRREAMLANQVHALDADRSRLAAELDTATARARKLETTNRDIAHRLDAAIESIRSIVTPPKH